MAYLENPERVVFGKKARDWTDGDLDEVRAKYLACNSQSRDAASVRQANLADFESRAIPQAKQALKALAARRAVFASNAQQQTTPVNRRVSAGSSEIVQYVKATGCHSPDSELIDLRGYGNSDRSAFGRSLTAWTQEDVQAAEVALMEQLDDCARRENYSTQYLQDSARRIRDHVERFRASLPAWQSEYARYLVQQNKEINAERARIAVDKVEDDARKAATRAACDQQDAEDAQRAQKEKDGQAICQKVLASGKYPAQIRAKGLLLLGSSSSGFDAFVCDHISHGSVVDYVKPIIGKERLEIKRGKGKVVFELVPYDQIGMRDTTWTVSNGSINGETFDTRRDHPFMIGEAMRKALYADINVPASKPLIGSLRCQSARQ